MANDACLQTVPRTINTGLGALFILVALYVLGGETLTDFALALLVGILVGTYSSVFTATPLAVWFEGLWDRHHGEPELRPLQPVSSPAPAPKTPVDHTAAQKAAHPASGSSTRPSPRPRKQRRKPARRR